MIGSIFALAAAAAPAPPVRAQALGTASVTIVQMERIDSAKPAERRSGGPKRQSRNRDGAPQIDFY
jgi:hypothetical protein